MKKDMKLNLPQLFLIGFGFLASSLAWSVYNSQVPLILEKRFLLSNTVIGIIMTIDNFFGVIFQPLIGTWSDKTRTPLGRRMPWIGIGLPICALFFALIPLQHILWAFMACIIIFNLVMSLWRSPVISLMPDVTPPSLRSEGNAIINLMGGVGAIVAFLVGGFLSDLREDKFFAFLMAAVIMLLSLLVLLILIREPDSIRFRKEKGLPISNRIRDQWALRSLEEIDADESANPEEDQEKISGFTAFLKLSPIKRRNLSAVLFAIFAWFMGFNAIETFFTIFATNAYDITGGEATMMLTGFSLAFLVFAIPAGIIGKKLGRRKTILLGLATIILFFIPILFVPKKSLVQVLLVLGGFSWAMININSLPLVLDYSTEKTVGTFTGYYYLFSFTAAIVSPILYGLIKDNIGNDKLLFIFAIIAFGLALVSMLTIKKESANND